MVEAATSEPHVNGQDIVDDAHGEEQKINEASANGVSVVNNLARQEIMGLPQNSQTSARVVL